MTATAPTLSVAESIPLVAAHAARVAEDAGIRLLLIKGRPATDLGVRADRPSVDVDVWVHPDDVQTFTSLLTQSNWHRVSPVVTDGVGWGHAIPMAHEHWACTLDVHHSFPGFLADARVVFDRVWQQRAMAPIAQQSISVPDVTAAAAITTLHAARSVSPEPQADADTAIRTVLAFDKETREGLTALLVDTGCVPTALDMEARKDSPSRFSADPKSRVWFERTRLNTTPGAQWWMALRSAPWSRRPAVLKRMLAPTPQDFAAVAARRGTVRGTSSALRYRLNRGARALPTLVVRLLSGRAPSA